MKANSKKRGECIKYIVLSLIGLICVIPFVWMIFSSFKNNNEIAAAVPTFLPKKFTFDNYRKIIKEFNFLLLFKNSLFVSILKTAIIIYTSALCGFVLSKYRFRGRKTLFYLILCTMMIPWPVTIIPQYNLMMKFGWMDSYLALIVPGVLSSFGIFMMKQFMDTIPNELIEAARMDGASEIFIFHRIIFPLTKNAISAIAIFHFLWSWEDFLWPYLVITSEKKQVLAVGLKTFNSRYYTDYGGLFAATALAIVPVLIVYLFFQKRFIEGVTMSGIKG